MFHNIPSSILERLAHLEAVDSRDRQDGTPKAQRLRQIPPETGRFLALLAASAPAGQVLEIGASGGYSSLWLTLACKERGDQLITFEVDPNKVRLANETFAIAGVSEMVQVIQDDARNQLGKFQAVAFCFLDVEKDLYPPCYELVIPNLVPGGIFVADNVISHQDQLQDFLQSAMSDARVDALIVPIGKGLLVCRKPVRL
ncbi:MAG: class I SAM-dependent methyltransferase [Anaerolineales bacterium]|nr:class I SAM-dependent methyltransferase [Anaerolineales bacterium]